MALQVICRVYLFSFNKIRGIKGYQVNRIKHFEFRIFNNFQNYTRTTNVLFFFLSKEHRFQNLFLLRIVRLSPNNIQSFTHSLLFLLLKLKEKTTREKNAFLSRGKEGKRREGKTKQNPNNITNESYKVWNRIGELKKKLKLFPLGDNIPKQ